MSKIETRSKVSLKPTSTINLEKRRALAELLTLAKAAPNSNHRQCLKPKPQAKRHRSPPAA